MISKNSFWANVREDNKRKSPLWIISFLFFFLIFPVGLTIVISNTRTQWEMYGFSVLTMEQKKQFLEDTVFHYLGRNEAIGLLWFAAISFAIVCGVQGFIYLHNKRKVDFYHALPVSKGNRFFITWLSGILIYLIPLLTGLLLGLVVIAVQGLMSGALLALVCKNVFLSLLLFLGVYHLVILAVMMTGHWFSLCAGITIFLFYELAIRYLYLSFCSVFFSTYSSFGQSANPVLSPVVLYSNLWNAVQLQDVVIAFLHLISFIVVTGLLAYVCYLKRPAEAAGKSMAFNKTKPVIKILVSVPATMALALLIREITYENIVFVVFSVIIGSILICCIMEVIYEFDIKAIWRNKWHILLTLLASSMIITIFWQDLLGYDRYVPDVDELESAAVASYSLNMDTPYFDETFRHIGMQAYAVNNVYLKDAEAIHDLAEKSDQWPDYSYSDQDHNYYYHFMAYRLKSGKTIYREIYLDYADEEVRALLNRIIQSEEYQDSYMISKDYYVNAIKGYEDDKQKIAGTSYYDNGLGRIKVNSEETDRLLQAIKNDLQNQSMEALINEYPIGGLEIELNQSRKGNENYSSSYATYVNIYAGFTNTIRELRAMGIAEQVKLTADDVSQIKVSYHYDMDEEHYKDAEVYGNYNYFDGYYDSYYGSGYSEEQSIIIKDKEEIKQLLEVSYYSKFDSSGSRGNYFNYAYRVQVFLEPEFDRMADAYDTNLSFFIKKGEVPEFLKARVHQQE